MQGIQWDREIERGDDWEQPTNEMQPDVNSIESWHGTVEYSVFQLRRQNQGVVLRIEDVSKRRNEPRFEDE